MDWLFLALPLLCLPIAALWLRRRRRIARGLQCWNCGVDLTDKKLHLDAQQRSRCPKCGNEMDVTDVYRLPSS